MIPGTHKNLYRIKSKKVSFIYTPFRRLVEDLEGLDSEIVKQQKQLLELERKYPVETEFLHLRLNSFRNYIEVQRRQFSGKLKYSFFQEDDSTVLPLNKTIVYPFDINKIERIFLDFHSSYRHDPVRNRLLNILFLYRSISQQTLMDLSGFSRSSVSRFLNKFVNRGYIQTLPREFRTPRIYYLESISWSTLANILDTDNFIYASVPRLKEIQSALKPEKQESAFLISKIDEIIKQIESFKRRNAGMRKAYQELSEFLGKGSIE
jgi:DNA-binding transcriptional regulator GbsR (MarR family)